MITWRSLAVRRSAALWGLALLTTAPATAQGLETRWGVVALYGQTSSVSSSTQGFADVAGVAIVLERELSRLVTARLELYPLQLYGQPDAPAPQGAHDRATVPASAACVLARLRLLSKGRWAPFVEAGAGPLYAYTSPVPAGGTRGNFFDQAGLGVVFKARNGDRWEALLRYVHVSNADLGRDGRLSNPGVSFLAAGIAWSRSRSAGR